MSNITTFQQRVQERIAETIADLVPEEDLAKMVAEQVAHFQRHTLPELIKTEITKQMAEAIKVEFSKPEYRPVYNQFTGSGASEAVTKLITENAGAILHNMLGGAIQQTVYQMQQNLPRY
jgi:4-aminobutyrate aminotransferase-like enzyme